MHSHADTAFLFPGDGVQCMAVWGRTPGLELTGCCFTPKEHVIRIANRSQENSSASVAKPGTTAALLDAARSILYLPSLTLAIQTSCAEFLATNAGQLPIGRATVTRYTVDNK